MNNLMNFIKKSVALALIHTLNFLPVKKNKIFLYSYYGSQYGCGPKYITEYVLANFPSGKYDIVWAFNTPEKHNIKGVRKVKTMSFRYFYELCTSKVVITNFRTTELFVKRKNQYYIQTWHSSLRLKQIEKDAENVLPAQYIKQAKEDSRKLDLLMSGRQYSSDIFKRSFWYEGEIFEHGIPRNDILSEKSETKRTAVLSGLGIDAERKVLLHAPTFRNNNDLDIYKLNYDKITENLKSRFGGDWVILVKLHPHLINSSHTLLTGENVRDVTAYNDIQEPLISADVLISDYSSLMFDYTVTGKPCFLYIPDYYEYTRKERKLYFDLDDLPFRTAQDMNQLLKEIEEFDDALYRNELDIFLTGVGTFENGTACEKLAERIDSICFSKKGSGKYEAV